MPDPTYQCPVRLGQSLFGCNNLERRLCISRTQATSLLAELIRS